MRKILLTGFSAFLCLSLVAQTAARINVNQIRKTEQGLQNKVKLKNPALLQLTGGITCSTNYIAGTTMNLNFTLALNNVDFEYGDSLSITFPTGITPLSSPTNPLGPDDGQVGSDGPEVLNGVNGQTITWGNNDNSYGGIVAGVLYPFVVNVSIAPGTTGIKLANFHVSGDGFGGNPADLNGTISLVDVPPVFAGCLPTNTYTTSAWQETASPGVIYSGYVCNGHDSLQTRSGWNFYDGDGYFVYLVAGGQYRFSLDSCLSLIALTVSDSNGVAGSIIGNSYANAACPNQLTFTAPYTGKYYINSSLNGLCGNAGASPIASGGVKLLNSVSCPITPAVPINDTICGAVNMTLGTIYLGDNTTASATDPRDGDVTAAGFACSTPSNTLWYSYTPVVSDTFFITVNSPVVGGLDAWVGLFEAASCSSPFVSGACLIGPLPGTSYVDTVLLTAGTKYFIMIDGYAGAVGMYDIMLTKSNGVTPVFNGCLPTNIYTASAWQEPTALGVVYNGYVCDGHDSLQTRSGWNFYDGDGYDVKLVAGAQYRITLDSCAAPIALTVSDSNGVAGAIISGAFVGAACPNQMTFTAPYTGKYYINASLNGICGNAGTLPIASAGVKLITSAICPLVPATPINDTICGAVNMTLGTTYLGDNTTASATDPRDGDATAAGFACSTPSNTLWYSYTPLVSDTFFITVNSPALGGLDAWVGLFEAASCSSPFVSGACLIGPLPGTSYVDTVLLTAGTKYFIMIDGYAGAVGMYDIMLTKSNGVTPVFNGCLPTNTYTASAWQEPTALGVVYSGYVCDGHDSLQTRSGWNFYDGDGYDVKLVAGAQYRITLDSCAAPIALTVSDSNGVAGAIISGAFAGAACPNQMTFTAPYTGKYYINASLNGICGNAGTLPIASAGVKLITSAICPLVPATPINDTICGAVNMTLGTTYLGDNTTASATDPRDGDVTAAGFACSAPSNTLWYSYTPVVSDTFFITVNSPALGGLDAWVGLFEAASCSSPFVSGACLIGPLPGTSYVDTVLLTAGTKYFIMIDGYAGAVGTYDIMLTQSNGVTPVFNGCLPTNTYAASAWQEPTALGVVYNGYVCDGHDSLQTRSGWNFYDGDGYFVNLVAGGQYRISLDSCLAPIALTVSDSNGVAGAIISGAFVGAACPNQMTFTAPYTGKYYINSSLNGICGNAGTLPIASGAVKLLNSVTCPSQAPAPINDTICGAIAMTLGTSYSGNTTTAAVSDPRDADATTAGFACSVPNNTLWYTYTAAASDTFFINVTSPAGGLDAWVGFFEAINCNSAFVSGACLLGPVPGTSYSDTVVLTAGSTYYIMLDGYNNSTGAFSLNITQNNTTTPTYPINDTICGALPLALGITVNGDNTTANSVDPKDAEAVSAGFNCDTPSNTLWYSYTAAVSDTFYITTTSSNLVGLATVVGVFEASDCSTTLSNGQCFIAATPGGGNHIDTVNFTAGTTYFIMVDGYNGASGTFDLILTKASHGVGLNHISLQGFSIYPNPSSGLVNLTTVATHTDIAVYNALGEKVMEQTNLAKGTHVVSLSNLAKGIYTIKASSENKVEMKTISISQ